MEPVLEPLGAGRPLLRYREVPELLGFEPAKAVGFEPFARYLSAERTVARFAPRGRWNRARAPPPP